jgi:hypothetical protein
VTCFGLGLDGGGGGRSKNPAFSITGGAFAAAVRYRGVKRLCVCALLCANKVFARCTLALLYTGSAVVQQCLLCW